MKKLFWGFFFIFLNFHLNFNSYSLNILPDFVGYLLLFQGTKALGAESHYFRSIQPFTVGMAVYTAILWVGNLLGVGGGSGYEQMLTQILSFVSTVVGLYVAWVLVQGVLETEDRRGADLNGQGVYKAWKVLTAIQVINTVVGWMVNLANIAALLVLVVPLVIVGVAVMIWYLMAWWKTAKAWETLPGQERGGPDAL